MKVCIDARYLSSSPSGIGRHSANLIRALAQLDRANEYVVFVHENWTPPEPVPANFRFVHVPWRPLSRGTLFRMGALIDRERADVVHVLNPVIPLRLKTPLIVTVHDWQPLMVPGFSGERPWPVKLAYDLFYRWHYPLAVRRARRVLTVSDYVRRETARLVSGSDEKCIVAHNGLAPAFHAPVDEQVRRAARERFGLTERFILFVGSTRPNKQLPTLLRAFARMTARRPDLQSVQLVLVLAVDRFFAETRKLMSELKIESRVRILENVNDDELNAFYCEAELLSMATTEEGFGYPVIEAMALGTPVVIADHGSLPEIAGESAMRVPPGDPDALARAFVSLLSNATLRKNFIDASCKQGDKFLWEAAARLVHGIYLEFA